MNLAVLLSKDIGNPNGMPPEWPVECRELGKSTQLPNDGKPWRLMTYQEVKDLQATHILEKEVWDSEFEIVEIKQDFIDEEYSKAKEESKADGQALDIEIKAIVDEKMEILYPKDPPPKDEGIGAESLPENKAQ